jgi:protein involved in polysaccharide export with SLBB domain
MKGDRTQNLSPVAGDTLRIGTYSGTVNVTGAVVRPAAFPFDRSWRLRDYLDAAGGLRPNADDNHISVEYASGGVASIHKHFLLPDQQPEVKPGSTIVVAARDTTQASGAGENLTRIAQITTTFVSLVIGIIAVTK